MIKISKNFRCRRKNSVWRVFRRHEEAVYGRDQERTMLVENNFENSGAMSVVR